MDDREEFRLRAVVDTAVDGVILIDTGGAVLMFNPACERLFGYRAEEVIGRNVRMLMPEPYRSEHDGYIAAYRRTREPRIIGIGREVTGLRRDGTTFPMELSVGEAQGERPFFVGIVRDLTERKRVEGELRGAVARLSAVLDTAVDGMILIDGLGVVQMFNPACEKLFGYRAEEVVGRNVKMLMPEPYRDEHDRYIASYHATGERKIIGIGREVVGRRKDGSTFPMELSVGEVRQAGISSFVGVIHDLSGRRETEAKLAQAQKMETVGQLSGGIAHDFNNLLTVVIGNAETLSERLKARPDLKELCDAILAAGERSAELTRRLLAFSRRQVLQPVVIDANRMIGDMRTLLRRMLREDVALEIAGGERLDGVVADPAQLESALLNLALNAQDAMPEGGRLIIGSANAALDEEYCRGFPDVRPGRYVMISVTDDGTGMQPEVAARAFEPFFTTKEVGKGSGLGLSMVYGFVKQSNGHVTIYSEVGLGTTVRLYLPAAEGSVGAATLAPSPPPPTSRPGETVMVVEDDAFVRAYAVSCLASLGYAVLTAVDGSEALAALAAGAAPDVLFTDVVMPGGVNGWDLAEQARAARPGLRVLLTSGYALETLAVRGRMPAGTVILNKPYRRAELGRRLREMLDADC
ncbi:MAG: PAS domain S-box protein [Alphaproteobacteria bacterium]